MKVNGRILECFVSFVFLINIEECCHLESKFEERLS